jgi:peptidoglycan/LPS O-acetylase OafA/YrhL
VLLNPSVADWRDALGYAVFLQSFEGLVTPIHFYSNPWWSLATEVQFYIALPLLAQLMRTRSGSILCAVLALVYAIAYARMVRAGFIPGSLLAGSLFGRAHVFGLGILAAWIHDAHGETIRSWCERRTWLRNGGADALLLGLLLALGLLLQAVSLSVFASETEWHAWHVVEGALWTGVLLVVLLAPLRLRSAIDNPLLRALGRISYSVYLTHFPVLFLALFSLAPGEGWTYHGTGVALLGFGITLGLSTLTYRYIERPFLERKVRLAPT